MADIPSGAIIVVGTGEGARLFRNRGDAQNLNLEFTGPLDPSNLAGEGPSGKSPPDQSDRESMEATFSKQLARHLYDIAYGGETETIVLILDPDTLGEVRPLLHKEVKDRLILELSKTLTNSPIEDIEKTLKAA